MHFHSLDCLYVNTSFLEVRFKAQVLPPGGSCEAVFTFYPREAKNYQEEIPFEMNSLSTFTVRIQGQGVLMKVSKNSRGSV